MLKAGVTLEVNVRSWSGLTPLHLAAMHGHKKMLRLLVHKFHADTRIRDAAGKRAWQYLEAPPPILQTGPDGRSFGRNSTS